MARTVNDIKNELGQMFVSNDVLASAYGLDQAQGFDAQFSKVSIESLLLDIVAYSIWMLEQLFDIHKSEIDTKLYELKPHTARWYRNKALAFLYGVDLIVDSDVFDVAGATAEQVEAAKVVKYAAVVESEDMSRLIIKIAGENAAGVLSPIPDGTNGGDDVKSAFDYYMSEVRDAGVRLTIINYLPDLLKLDITIKRDPLVLDANGVNILSVKEPVKDAIKAFMKELPFNGELSLQALTDKIQGVPGVLDLSINTAQTTWIDAEADAYGNYEFIYMSKIPVSGYFAVELDNDQEQNYSNISYV